MNKAGCAKGEGMEPLMYMMMIEKSKTYNKLTKKIVIEHVENIRKLDDEGKLEICGVFKGYPGMAGMYILKTNSREEAEEKFRLRHIVCRKKWLDLIKKVYCLVTCKDMCYTACQTLLKYTYRRWQK